MMEKDRTLYPPWFRNIITALISVISATVVVMIFVSDMRDGTRANTQDIENMKENFKEFKDDVKEDIKDIKGDIEYVRKLIEKKYSND